MVRLIESKIKTINNLKKIISSLKRKGKKIVFTNGCFDLLHYGHIKYLEEARKMGDVLVVGINSNASVKRLKRNSRPIVNERQRLRLVAALESIDYAVLFNQDTPYRIIKQLRPDVLVKGADWNKNDIVGRDTVLRQGGVVRTIKFIQGYSTTKLIGKIAKSLKN